MRELQVMKLQHNGDEIRTQRLKCSPRVPLSGWLFFFSVIAALHLASAYLQAATVYVHPGNNIPNIVSSNPPGTTFYFYPGLYRLQTPIVAKNGDTFTGQNYCSPPSRPCPAAILSGAELLTSFQRLGSLYYVTGQTQHGQVTITSQQCEPMLPAYPTAYPGCIYPEDLYFDGVPLVHVTALTHVGPGKWFFDYNNHIIYFYDSPYGHTVETSVVPSAFALGPANNVTIENLTVEKFAAPILKPAIGGIVSGSSSTTGANWTVQNNEIRLNHGAGVGINFGWQILNNYIHHSGDFGIGGGLNNTWQQSGILIQGNELAFNNYAHVKPGFGAGGVKISRTLGVIFRGNYSHDNEGSGFHADNGSYGTLFDSNTSTNNTEQGIFHEISYHGTFRNNQLVGNGYIHPNGTFWLYGANLLSSTSQNDEAYCNTVEVSEQGGNGINIIAQLHAPGGSTTSQNNYFHHNTVIFDGPSGVTGAGRGSKTDFCCINFYYLNKFDYNTYHLPSLSRSAFFWSDVFNTFAQFRAAGEELHGSADTDHTGSVPNVVITSPADKSAVSGRVVEVEGNAPDYLSKVELYVDWKLQQTTKTNPFRFAWNTSGVTPGNHTLAAMAYNTQGMSACYAVSLQVQ
jgi:parallel beta-helix repeat protein